MQNLLCGCGSRGALVKVIKMLPDSQFAIYGEDCKERVSLQLMHVLNVIPCGEWRTDISTIKMLFQIGQDGL